MEDLQMFILSVSEISSYEGASIVADDQTIVRKRQWFSLSIAEFGSE
jgi:hypothetical protein